jgi:hypothetical protein
MKGSGAIASKAMGFHAVEHRHYVTDFLATLLHQLGLVSLGHRNAALMPLQRKYFERSPAGYAGARSKFGR